MAVKSTVRTDNETNKFVNNSRNEVCVNTCAEINNTAANPVPVQFVAAGTPTIFNIDIEAGDINSEQSQLIPNDVKKILIQHDGNGTINFAFTASFTESITIPRGTTYSEQGLDLQSKTLYFKTNKIGKVEILVWA